MCEALDQVGPLHLRQRGVEGVLTEAGDDQTHQAGVNHHLVHDVLQACSHRTDQRGQRHRMLIAHRHTNTARRSASDLLCAMCCCSTASGPCSCSAEVGAPVRWSKSSRRTTEGCLHSACSKVSCSICLTVSARLPGKKKKKERNENFYERTRRNRSFQMRVVDSASVYLGAFCSPLSPHVHPDVVLLRHRGLGTECSFRFPVRRQVEHAERLTKQRLLATSVPQKHRRRFTLCSEQNMSSIIIIGDT